MAPCTNRTLLLLPILLFCALAAAATIVFPLATSPCDYSLSRSILALTAGVDPYFFSCAGDASEAALSSEDAGADKKASSGGPIVTDLLWCGDPDLPAHALPPFRCCPPMSASEPVNFTFPDPAEPLRTRRPVHKVGAEYMAKYARAVALMKALPEDDPRSFYQQSNIHCAYCTGAYRQVGRPELPVQIHFSWLFFPFHRAYLYFFERIAAKLLGDPGFAMPFWSWDVPEGMRIPAEFADMISNAPLPSLFHGQPYRAGDAEKPGAGTVEIYPHNTMHGWTGDISRPNHEDMGVYYSAGRDPIFYPHHANIDRLWEAWRSIGVARGNRRQVDFTDPDWLDSSFLFYDEDARLVRVTVRDMLHMGRLRYRYAGVGLPWLSARPTATPGVNRGRGKLKSVNFPVNLDDAAVSVEVRRPVALRSRREKEAMEEVLVVEGVETDGAEFVKFDVYVNAVEYKKVGPGGREMAGSFVSLKHPGKEGEVVRTSLRLALNELLEDLNADGDRNITVTLVPVKGKARIGGLRIVYASE
ncbi:hypothetical protein EJB05_16684, partial [Eragrostis curvula]